jgi:hypothetical protein
MSAVLLRARSATSKAQLVAALRDLAGALGDDITVIDTSVPCEEGVADVDLIVMDSTGRFGVVDVDVVDANALFLKGLAHIDWVVRHRRHLQHVYRSHGIDLEVEPRLFLVVPRVPPVEAASRQIGRSAITWVEYRVVEVPGGTGIMFEPRV